MTQPNLVLKGIINEIASRTSSGRMTLDWGIIYERSLVGKKKPEGTPPEEDETPVPEKTDAAVDAPSDTGDAGTDIPPAEPDTTAADSDATDPANILNPTGDSADGTGDNAEPAQPDASEEDVKKTKDDVAKLNAEKAKASAEKEKAEQELEDDSFIKLNSGSGVGFLLGKAIETAFNNNTIDALANEFVQKLKITTQDDFNIFSEEMIQYNTIPGVANLLSSMSNIISKQ